MGRKKTRVFTYSCDKCFFSTIEDEQKMKDHVMKVHGITGIFKKGYHTNKRYKR